MASLRVGASGICCVAALLFAVVSIAQAETSQDLDMLLTGALQCADSTFDGRVKGKYTRTKYSAGKAIVRAEGVFSAAFAGDAVRYTESATDDDMRSHGIMSTTSTTYYDGAKVYRYGGTKVLDIYDSTNWRLYVNEKKAFPHLYISSQLGAWKEALDTSLESVTAEVRPVSDSDDVVLTIRQADDGSVGEMQYWICPDKGYAIRKRIRKVDEQTMESVESELAEDPQGRWLPRSITVRKWERAGLMGGTKLSYDLSIDYEVLELNVGVLPEELPIKVPAGTWVMDNIAGVSYRSDIVQRITEDSLRLLQEKHFMENQSVPNINASTTAPALRSSDANGQASHLGSRTHHGDGSNMVTNFLWAFGPIVTIGVLAAMLLRRRARRIKGNAHE